MADRQAEGLRRVEDGLGRFFASVGAGIVDVPILQPSDPYLDTAGEALRRRIFLTKGEDGRGLCLRPDFTIPVCLSHIAAGAGLPRRYAYCGMIFRQNASGPSEYPQAGIEDLGDGDRAHADGRTIADAIAAISACGIDARRVDTVVGDQALFEAFLKSLGLPSGWQRRLIRTFGQDAGLRQALEALATGGGRVSLDNLAAELYELAVAGDLATLVDEIRDRMEEGGLPMHRGRTPQEIAERLMEKVAVAETRLDRTVLERLRAFLSIDCTLDRSVDALDLLCRESGTDLGGSLAAFRARNAALSAAGVDLSGLRYRAAFGRALDYYTGMVFEISAPGLDGPLAGGGRYDRLVSYLGAAETIPAVGFALWPQRMALTLEEGAR